MTGISEILNGHIVEVFHRRRGSCLSFFLTLLLFFGGGAMSATEESFIEFMPESRWQKYSICLLFKDVRLKKFTDPLPFKGGRLPDKIAYIDIYKNKKKIEHLDFVRPFLLGFPRKNGLIVCREDNYYRFPGKITLILHKYPEVSNYDISISIKPVKFKK